MGASIPAHVISVPVKRLSEHAKLPSYGSAEAAGMDLYVDLSGMKGFTPEIEGGNVEFTLYAGQRALLQTNVAVELPTGTFGDIRGRSGLANKNGIAVLGGIIDSDYRGPLGVILLNTGSENIKFKHHDRIAQMIVTPHNTAHLVEVEELSGSERGTGALGSTGR
ncbi:dUTP diphosphatase [Agrobacterium sp. CG674]